MSQTVVNENIPTVQQNRRLKVLLSAYACEPNRGSEPGVGWNTACEMARYHQVWVLVSQTHRDAIDAELSQNPIPNLHIVYLDPLNWVYDWSQEGKRPHWDSHLHYYFWQIKAYFVAQRLHQALSFDLVHHVTYVKYSSPSFLALLPIPFLWGPVGGAESSPKCFWQGLSLRAILFEVLRTTAQRMGELDPFVRLTARRSQIAWATTEETARGLQRVGAQNVQVFSQVGLNEAEISMLADYAALNSLSLRFVSIGRLLHWKGFHLGLRAFAQADLPAETEYWIVGEGPEKQRLQTLAQTLAIANRVKFCNRLPRTTVLQHLGNCLALVHPSLHDSGGLVCLEAMAAGCPVICLDLGGPGIQVTMDTGFKVAAHTPEQAIQAMAEAMAQLTHDPNLRSQMAKAGQQRVQAVFSWNRKAEMFNQVYQSIVQNAAVF